MTNENRFICACCLKCIPSQQAIKYHGVYSQFGYNSILICRSEFCIEWAENQLKSAG